MRNEHLIPANVVDIVQKLESKDLLENELGNYLLRLETIRDYCSQAITKYHNGRPIDYSKNKRLNPTTRKIRS